MLTRQLLWGALAVCASAPAFAQYPPPPGYQPAYPGPYQNGDDATCRSWGAVPGTRAYFECRATLDENRRTPGPPPPSPPWGPNPPPNNDISDRDALAYCEKTARLAPPYPIVKLAAKTVAPGREKIVSLSFAVIKGGKTGFWNVQCRFRHGKMTNFSGPR